MSAVKKVPIFGEPTKINYPRVYNTHSTQSTSKEERHVKDGVTIASGDSKENPF